MYKSSSTQPHLHLLLAVDPHQILCKLDAIFKPVKDSMELNRLREIPENDISLETLMNTKKKYFYGEAKLFYIFVYYMQQKRKNELCNRLSFGTLVFSDMDFPMENLNFHALLPDFY
ncbi:hypothetical protein CHS0354_012510 [Potamilus streckersoni]|uniref:Uncharacterized protein n=1 Tax=Potamilus streckersoni TaxID=2493646 RepID=A0AAE0W2H2_9BIVA|nr:hypothetical protein CHS0354_012510 [Potamilus streckersoni]